MRVTELGPPSESLEQEIVANIDAPDTVIPYIAGLGVGGYWWLQTEPVAAERVVATGGDLNTHAEILSRFSALDYEELYALDMELEVDGELLTYTAFVLHDLDNDEVDMLDPVALGVGSVPEYLPRHSQVGESENDTWIGCKAFHQQPMPQGEMEHWDGSCWDKASCADEAIGKIFCDVNQDSCPRVHGTTVQSGSCTNTAGGGFFCTGPEASSVNSKETTSPNGNCQDNINVELWWGPTSNITWEIEIDAGAVKVKFGGTTPSHSIYQVYKLTMCCVAEAGTSGTGTSGTSDTSSGGDSYTSTGSATSGGDSYTSTDSATSTGVDPGGVEPAPIG